MEMVGSTQQRLDVLEQSIARMSSQAEQHGAVQQVRADVVNIIQSRSSYETSFTANACDSHTLS